MGRLMRYGTWMLLAAAWPGLAGAAAEAARSFALPEHGALELKVPPAWQETVERTQGLPPTLHFNAREGAQFEVMLTPLWPPRAGTKLAGPEEIKAGVQRSADHAAKQSVERVIQVQALKGKHGAGHYFSATDRKPRAGEYKYMTQGIVALGEVHLGFTILTNDGQEAVVKDALEMLAGARHRKD